ncbi:MAG: hypothetical protein Q7U38_03660 [Methylobacter sp.]|nr:hypothetical protein [Methylobacter sp.]MDP2097649.1 hypothetical protein [Methylobacter sp.]MDP2427927.1 hypothetical protein [Methylobacter sp.]MDP3056575.1 hypothetical protein [Methylobacter sp.]MDZ4217460.1 hypothetical protein [Methylobacter sp.]
MDALLIKAEQDIAKLNLRGRGRKCQDENKITGKVSSIMTQHKVDDLLTIELIQQSQTAHKRAYAKRSPPQ